jgi:hypothetical protein
MKTEDDAKASKNALIKIFQAEEPRKMPELLILALLEV